MVVKTIVHNFIMWSGGSVYQFGAYISMCHGLLECAGDGNNFQHQFYLENEVTLATAFVRQCGHEECRAQIVMRGLV